MQTMFRIAALASLVLVFSGAARAEPLNCTFIAGVPFTISAPGNYCLDGSFTVAGIGVDIVADDVVLDFNGHVLDGVSGKGLGVRATDRKSITVRNGTVRNFSEGIYLGGSAGEGYVVEQMRVVSNGDSGISVQGRGAVVRRNLLIGNGNSPVPGPRWSMSIISSGAHIVDNEIIDTALGVPSGEVDGIRMAFAPRSTVERNVISNASASSSFSRGISLLNSSGSTLVGNRIAGYVYGILFSGGTGLYMDNTVSGATTPFFGGTAAGTTNFSF
jgi:parallel beta-helix repeat protein